MTGREATEGGYYSHTAAVSRVVLITGVGALAVLAYASLVDVGIPATLRSSLRLFTWAFLFHVLQYAVLAIVWFALIRRLELNGEDPDADFEVTPWINVVGEICWAIKTGLVLAGIGSFI